MSQLSLFSADLTPPRLEDLTGLLAAHGQTSSSATGARLSIVLVDHWRARALLREFRVRDVPAEAMPIEDLDMVPEGVVAAVPGDAPNHGWLVRSDRLPMLTPLATDWTRGAVKAVPAGLSVEVGWLRCWSLAAGWRDHAGYCLGLDPRAPDTHEFLVAALAHSGLAGVHLSARGGGPAVRILGHRRLARLAEMIGSPPPEAPVGSFPDPALPVR